jgi:hypothetical protein
LTHPDEPLQALRDGLTDRDLPDHDVDPLVAERIRRRATAVLRQQQKQLRGARSAWVSLWYHRALEPMLLIGLGASYLAWAVRGTLALLH